MTIHNLYIFDRSGSCLFYSEWHRRRAPGIPQEERMAPQESPGHPPGGANGTAGEPRASPRSSRAPGIPQEEEFKLMFGMLFSLRSFVNKMSPTDMKDGFISFHTSRYRLHYLETPSGLRLALNTDLSVGSAREALQHIYSNLFVELVVKNPLCPPRAPVQSVLFRQRLDAFVRSLPYFGPKNPNS